MDLNNFISFSEEDGEKFLKDENLRKQIIENTLIFLNSENGSKIIQKIYNDYPLNREEIFNKIYPYILDITKSDKGNYLIQKIIESDVSEQKKIIKIFNKIKAHILELSIHNHGTYIIQKIIEKIKENYLIDISKELEWQYIYLIKDKNGNRVIQNLIIKQNKEENDKIYEKIENNLIELSMNKYGCHVIQELLNNCNEITYYKIFQKIFENINSLIKDKSGNYLIQYFLEDNTIKNIKNLDIIYQSIKGHIFDFCLNKHSVYIVEKILELGNEIYRKKIINEILELNKVKKDCLIVLTKNQYGNHVMQLLLKFCDMKTKKLIIEKILSDKDVKNKEGYSSHVLEYIEALNIMNNGAFDYLKIGN